MTQIMDQAVHVRVNGRSEELTMTMLNLESNASDAQIKQAVASRLDLPRHSLNDHVIVRSTHAVIVRPEAIYG